MKRVVVWVICLGLVTTAVLVGKRHRASAPHSNTRSPRVLYYVDPMHPAYRSPHPGVAPDCGMQLEPVYDIAGESAGRSASATAQGSPEMPPDAVLIDRTAQQLIGLQTVAPAISNEQRSLRVPGKVAADDTRVYKVTAGTDGWLRETFDSALGGPVQKNQTLATFYSPDFVALEQGYLVATERMSAGMAVKQAAAQGTQSSAARLRNLGMSETQIREISETRQMPEEIKLVSPASGFIVARNVSAGERFEKGAELYRIADLSHVWIIADLPVRDAAGLRSGMVARVLLPGTGKTMRARISYVLPEADPVSGTLKVRLETDNPGTLLRPGTIVDVDLPAVGTNQLTIPVEALVDSGLRKRVFISLGNGAFEPRMVETGEYFGDRVEILRGLSPTDKVVASGTFLVDSESRMKAAAPTDAGSFSEASADHMRSHPSSKQENAGGSVTRDPKCGMSIGKHEAETASNILEFQHKKYYFCSRKCKEGFAKDPQKYLSSPAPAASRG